MNIKKTIEITVPSELETVFNLETIVKMLNRAAGSWHFSTYDSEGLVEQPVSVSFEPVCGDETVGVLVRHEPVGEPCTCLRDRPDGCAVHRPIKKHINYFI
jgi:hypothetical protein